MSDLAFNVWGAITGILGTIALIPVFLAWLQTRLPTTKLPHMIDSFRDTEELFLTAVRDGLFTNEDELQRFNINMWTVTMYVEEMRYKVYAAQTWRQDVVNWWQGLSGRITTLCGELNSLRMKLAERNSMERRRLASLGVVTGWSLRQHHTKGHWNANPGPYGLSPFYPPHGSYDPSTGFTHALRGFPLYGVRYAPSEATPSQSHTSLKDGSPILAPHEAGSGATYHIMSDADLQSLLSFALTPLTDAAKHQGAVLRGEILLSGGRKLRYSFGGTSGKHAKHNRFRALCRLIRRAYGVRPREAEDVGGGFSSVDPESLMPLPTAGTSGRDDDGWEDI
ncbi:hypothetical protein GY45DRAFT_751133 [Cubamyces sp. BRFM 1775]|nr:hypothetical protein GY45DRAFT_751133 [Cubamyces sp. BRFM 1775]